MRRRKKYRFSSLSPSLLPVLLRCPASLHDGVQLIESLSKNNGDSNKNGKKAIDLISETTTLHVHHAFFTFICPTTDVKMPKFAFRGGSDYNRLIL